MANNSIAILQFNHSDKQEISLKEIAPRVNKKGLSKMLCQLEKRTSSIASKSEYSLFQYNIVENISFEQQLYKAYQQLFDKDFKHVIGIANDCPSLETRDIEQAAHQLQKNKLVFGPAEDGGLYLLGISKGSFHKNDFLNLSWRTEKLYEDVVALAKASKLAFISLETKADMDTVEEFKRAFLSHYTFLNILRKLIASFQFNFFRAEKAIIFEKLPTSLSLRGPPFRA